MLILKNIYRNILKINKMKIYFLDIFLVLQTYGK